MFRNRDVPSGAGIWRRTHDRRPPVDREVVAVLRLLRAQLPWWLAGPGMELCGRPVRAGEPAATARHHRGGERLPAPPGRRRGRRDRPPRSPADGSHLGLHRAQTRPPALGGTPAGTGRHRPAGTRPVAIIGEINFVTSLRRTRSGKIMRRLLRAVTLGRDPATSPPSKTTARSAKHTKPGRLCATKSATTPELPVARPPQVHTKKEAAPNDQRWATSLQVNRSQTGAHIGGAARVLL